MSLVCSRASATGHNTGCQDTPSTQPVQRLRVLSPTNHSASRPGWAGLHGSNTPLPPPTCAYTSPHRTGRAGTASRTCMVAAAHGVLCSGACRKAEPGPPALCPPPPAAAAAGGVLLSSACRGPGPTPQPCALLLLLLVLMRRAAARRTLQLLSLSLSPASHGPSALHCTALSWTALPLAGRLGRREWGSPPSPHHHAWRWRHQAATAITASNAGTGHAHSTARWGDRTPTRGGRTTAGANEIDNRA